MNGLEVFYFFFGASIIYAIVHFFFLQQFAYKERTVYGKVITVYSMVMIGLLLLSTMIGE
jgi:hypothetical protein